MSSRMDAEHDLIGPIALANRLGFAQAGLFTSIDEVLQEVEGKFADLRRAHEVLLRLNEWDMLSLDHNGRGAATGDAPWARDIIGRALGEPGVLDTTTSHARLVTIVQSFYDGGEVPRAE